MNRLIVTIIVLLLLVSENLAMAQKKEKAGCNRELVKSSRLVNYGVVTVDEIKQDMKSVLTYLEKNTPFRVVNKQNVKSSPNMPKWIRVLNLKEVLSA